MHADDDNDKLNSWKPFVSLIGLVFKLRRFILCI